MSAVLPEEIFDIVIVGSGGGAMPAALKAKTLGLSAVILEKQPRIGGSTAYSGGVLWIPDNPLMRRAGAQDSLDEARKYLNNLVTDAPGSTPEKREAYLESGPEVIGFLEQHGMKFRRPLDYPDYYSAVPGATVRTRSLTVERFDLNRLGAMKQKLLMWPGAYIPMGADELGRLVMAKRTLGGKLMALKMIAILKLQKLLGREYHARGAALQGRMLEIAIAHDLDIRTETAATALIEEDGRVAGVTCDTPNGPVRFRARRGVILNTGGFARNDEMRAKYHPVPSTTDFTLANPGDTGEMMQAVIGLGAALDYMDQVIWSPVSSGPGGVLPDEAMTRDGRRLPISHTWNISCPHAILVDQAGRRFANEAGSYMEIGQRQYRRQAETGHAIPAWAILDQRHRDRYLWGPVVGRTPQKWLDSGYMIKADSLGELAARCGIDADGLRAEVERFNGFCRAGRDDDFGRGNQAFDRSHGDPTVRPNPNLGTIEQGPFYAVRIVPGDVGTVGGLVTDPDALVQRKDGTPIPGLYAIGNTAACLFGDGYPGGGTSIGASFIFGYRAVEAIARGHAASTAAVAAEYAD